MGFDDLVKLIQTRLGFNFTQQVTDAIAMEVRLAQYQLEKDVTYNPWFLWRAADVCVDETCLSLALPNGFLRLCEFNNPLFHPEGMPCGYQITRRFADSVYSSDMPVGKVDGYTLQAKSIRLNARAKGKLRIFYITANAKLSPSTQQNLWTEHAFDLLMNLTGRAVAGIIKNESAMQQFTQDYAMALSSFKRQCVAYEDHLMELSREVSLYSSYNEKPVGGFYDATTGAPCDCGGTP